MTSKTCAIIDYGMGNLHSVRGALSGVLTNLYNNPTQENYAKAMLAITTSSASSSILKDGIDAFRRSIAAGLDGLNSLTEAIVNEK